MNILLTFLSKWGNLITILLILTITFSTCGVKGHVERLEKKVVSLEQQINYNDSVKNIKHSIELEIYNLKIERSTLHNMNEIVLKNIRPSEKIAEIDEKIDMLSKQLKNIK